MKTKPATQSVYTTGTQDFRERDDNAPRCSTEWTQTESNSVFPVVHEATTVCAQTRNCSQRCEPFCQSSMRATPTWHQRPGHLFYVRWSTTCFVSLLTGGCWVFRRGASPRARISLPRIRCLCIQLRKPCVDRDGVASSSNLQLRSPKQRHHDTICRTTLECAGFPPKLKREYEALALEIFLAGRARALWPSEKRLRSGVATAACVVCFLAWHGSGTTLYNSYA